MVPADDVFRLDGALLDGDVSQAWLIWSHAENALADAYRLAGGPEPDRGVKLGRGYSRFSLVRLGGPKMRCARSRCADPGDGAQVDLYRDNSKASLIHLRRRLRSVLDVVGAVNRSGYSLVRGLELTRQWGKVLRCGPLGTVTEERLRTLSGLRLPGFGVEVGLMHDELHEFLHDIVVCRKDCAVRGWRAWILEDPLVQPYRWLRPDLVPPSPFLQCDPAGTIDGSGVLSDPSLIDQKFRVAWLPYFCRSVRWVADFEGFSMEVEGGWLPTLDLVDLPPLTGDMLSAVVKRKKVSAGSLDGWGWRGLKVLSAPWFDALARILCKVEAHGVWPEGLLDAYIAMIPKVDCDATLLGQRPLCVLPVVYRVLASARMMQLEPWFKSWVPHSVFSAGKGQSSVEAWFSTAAGY